MVAIFVKYSWTYLPCLREKNQSVALCSAPWGERDRWLLFIPPAAGVVLVQLHWLILSSPEGSQPSSELGRWSVSHLFVLSSGFLC